MALVSSRLEQFRDKGNPTEAFNLKWNQPHAALSN